MSNKEIVEKVLTLKKEKNAVILAHYYQTGDIQDIADFTGDSLGLAQRATEVEAPIIVFAGVHFMAETAKILNPTKKVLIPDMEAGCSLADGCPPEDFKRFKEKFPDHIVISYINCSAAIKTMSDIICTSSNAEKIVDSLPKDEKIIFAPDKNLGAYINAKTNRNMVLWDATCEVHDILSVEKIIMLKKKHPKAKIIAHPECKGHILAMADYVGSTTQMLKFTQTDEAQTYIVATESGILHQMKKNSPHKTFIIVPADETCACNDCPYMKLNTMKKIYDCLKNEQPEVILDEDVIEKAKIPIEKMLILSRKLNIIK